ncbi:external alternative NAD(P)H-ubiquinone oxidoreductase B4, mitochondrial [Artemisia annua]|uniref:External alternative NAD(P)H-ubiquinone oxidoreductase B4, mitochondrial n=1 Tax=Artemisia annua TaxID=35608 RepID=A0A2U1NK31_ARTAN|nr:external alternative NAD(P)H-ubiquinone oxidoreductase B4, mitochondrial [Artemisia annua]
MKSLPLTALELNLPLANVVVLMFLGSSLTRYTHLGAFARLGGEQTAAELPGDYFSFFHSSQWLWGILRPALSLKTMNLTNEDFIRSLGVAVKKDLQMVLLLRRQVQILSDLCTMQRGYFVGHVKRWIPH